MRLRVPHVNRDERVSSVVHLVGPIGRYRNRGTIDAVPAFNRTVDRSPFPPRRPFCEPDVEFAQARGGHRERPGLIPATGHRGRVPQEGGVL